MNDRDSWGKAVERAANAISGQDGVRVRARYSPSDGKLYYQRWLMNRQAILDRNKVLYEQNRGKFKDRNDMVGGIPMSIPEDDLEWIRKRIREMAGMDLEQLPKEEQRKIFEKIYQRNPEYRIG